MEKIEERMIYKVTSDKPREEQEAIINAIPSELLLREILRRLALCEGVLGKMAGPEYVKETLYKP